MDGAAGTEPGAKNANYIFGRKWQVIGQRNRRAAVHHDRLERTGRED
ncbi:hypothetical protein QJQ58_02315 [Paenibacillus dendritiformis]|nr:hypothetical protein [Paenibacillus dendritiformis]WGU95128.1 hypothetical protein QJQ58_02315 [Paenibacillus dendritiformis]